MPRSTGRKTYPSQVRLPLNTAVRYKPIGLVISTRMTKYTRICATPLKVNDIRGPLHHSLEHVGPQQRDHKVDPDQERDNAHDDVFETHHILRSRRAAKSPLVPAIRSYAPGQLQRDRTRSIGARYTVRRSSAATACRTRMRMR